MNPFRKFSERGFLFSDTVVFAFSQGYRVEEVNNSADSFYCDLKDFAENTPSKRRYNLRMVRNSFPGAPNKTVHRVRIVENDLFPKTLGKTAPFSLLDVEKKLCGKPVSIWLSCGLLIEASFRKNL